MAKTKAQIIKEVDTHINKSLPYSSWYCGIATDAKKRLFEDHNVPPKNHYWIYSECENDTIAREIEDHFLKNGCKGGDGGGSKTTVYVYAYKIESWVTKE